MTLIFWGTTTQQKPIGQVVDFCPFCETLQVFSINDHFKADHIQFIRTEDWIFVTTSRQCASCRSQFQCQKNKYASIASPVNQQLSFDDLLKKTNPRLLSKLQEEARSEIQNEPFDHAGSAAKVPRVVDLQEINKKLQSLEIFQIGDPDIFKLREKLRLWKSLNDKQRYDFAAEVDELCAFQAKVLEIKDFLLFTSINNPSNASNIVGIITSCLLFMTLAAMYFIPVAWDGCTGSLYIGCAVVGFTLIYGICQYTAAEMWFRKVLIPRVKTEGIHMRFLLEVVRSIPTWTAAERARAGFIAADADLLCQMVEMELEKDGTAAGPP